MNRLIITLYFFVILALLPGSIQGQIVYNEADTLRLPQQELQEVQITSMRQAGRLSGLPVSAAVVGQQQLQQAQALSLKQATPMVGNLFMPDYGSRLTSPVYIRGIGSRINAPSVGLYVDQIPYFEKSVFDFDLLNAERIEVLRGPQGTLYGRNTMGGLINVVSQSPFRYQGTDISLGGGSAAQFNGLLSHYQMLSPSLGVSVSGGVNRHEGYFRNEYLDQMADAHLSAGARLRMIWQVNSALSAEFTSHYEHLDQGGYPYAILDRNTGEAQAVSYNEASSYQRKMNSNGLVFNYSTPGIQLQWVSALQYFDDLQSIDQDFSVLDLAFATQRQQQWMFSQELIARSPQGGSYQWVFGLFGFSQRLDHELDIAFGQDAVSMGMVPGLLSRHQFSDNRIRGAAVFHQSSLHDLLLPGLSLTAGMRLDHERASLDHEAFMEAGFPTPPPTGFSSELGFYQWLPRLGMNYELSPGNALYAALVRGYKTGGFNVVFEAEEDRSFLPEHSWNYELGFKGQFLQQRIALQTALFYIDWKNQQIYQMLPSGQGSMLKNAGVSVSRGFELDLQARLSQRLQLNASYGYTHASFLQNQPNNQTDLAGNFIPYVPRYTFFAGGSYRFALASESLQALVVNLNYQGVGEHFWNDANTASQPAYGLLNLMLSLEAPLLGVDFFARNITSADYHAFHFAALGNQYVQQGRPATFGINLRYSIR